jgi:hypothetical protein
MKERIVEMPSCEKMHRLLSDLKGFQKPFRSWGGQQHPSCPQDTGCVTDYAPSYFLFFSLLRVRANMPSKPVPTRISIVGSGMPKIEVNLVMTRTLVESKTLCPAFPSHDPYQAD